MSSTPQPHQQPDQEPGQRQAGSGYLDTASGEPLHPAAREVMVRALDQVYADPRRLYGPARSARLVLDNARGVVAECLGVRPDEVIFTASGTHAVHLGVLGLLTGRPGADGRGAAARGRLVASAVEHSAVLHAGQWHAARGGSFDTLAVDETGRVRVEELSAVLFTAQADGPADGPEDGPQYGPPTVVAVQAANHEVGTRQPLAEVAAALEGTGTGFFVDACASGGREPLPAYGEVIALSAHKWGGPAGVGVLVVRRARGTRWRSPFPADDRVDERSIGFENIPAALAAAAALQATVAERDVLNQRHRAVTAQLRARLAEVPDTAVLGHPDERLPHLVAASCLYVDGEALVTELDRRGWSVASGSACTASTLAPSHVLEAMGVLTHGNLRISLGRDTTAEQVDRLLVDLPDAIATIRARIEW